ncbi:ANTAR domain-containing protein [Rathayibacter tritici]|nr:ANTAR domain-containing protein [Rathayibacter tritici]PPG08308.1 ANTAR domain-containing protein [Rathayibacter tritici]PPI43702.1 ANTAR domain-containing protein [Rathayibacter tritici]
MTHHSYRPPTDDAAAVSDTEDLAVMLASLITLLPFEEAAASSLGPPFDVETLASSSLRAASLDEAQLDLGEGPAWDAFRSRRPVHASLAETGSDPGWPFLASSFGLAGVCSVLALPLSFGPLRIGAVTLFASDVEHTDDTAVKLAQSIVALMGRAVSSRALAETQSGAGERDGSLARREVHQATGMILSQTGIAPDDALLILRAYAYSHSRTLRDVAADVVARRLDFSPDHDH